MLGGRATEIKDPKNIFFTGFDEKCTTSVSALYTLNYCKGS